MKFLFQWRNKDYFDSPCFEISRVMRCQNGIKRAPTIFFLHFGSGSYVDGNQSVIGGYSDSKQIVSLHLISCLFTFSEFETASHEAYGVDFFEVIPNSESDCKPSNRSKAQINLMFALWQRSLVVSLGNTLICSRL